MKKILSGLAILVVLVAGVAVAKNVVANAAVVGGVRAMTGLELHIDHMDVGVLKSALRVRGLMVYNPAGFPDKAMLDLPELYVHYDIGALWRRRVHLEEVRLDLSELTVVKNAQGHLNLDALTVVQTSKARTAAAPTRSASAMPEIQIDVLRLKIGKVVYKDYAGGTVPQVHEFPINIDERYERITNPQAFAALVVSRALVHTTVAKLTGFDLGALQSEVGAQLMHAAKQFHGAAAQVIGAAGAVAGGVRSAAQGATDVSKGAAEAVKDVTQSLKKALPFGQ